MFRKNRTHIRFKITTNTLGELNCLITTAIWNDLSEKANTGKYDTSPENFIRDVLAKIIPAQPEQALLEKLSDDELELCKNDIFQNSKKYLFSRQKVLRNDVNEEKQSAAFGEFLGLVKDIKKANEKEQFERISSLQTLSVAEQLETLTANLSSESETPELIYKDKISPEPTLPLKKIEEVLQKQNKLLMSSEIDTDKKYKEGRKWNWTFFGVSIIALVASVIVGGIQISQANNSSKETEHILSSQQALISKQNELLSKILKSQETTNNQLHLVLSEESSNTNKEVLNTLRSIESLLIKNNALLTQPQKEPNTDK